MSERIYGHEIRQLPIGATSLHSKVSLAISVTYGSEDLSSISGRWPALMTLSSSAWAFLRASGCSRRPKMLVVIAATVYGWAVRFRAEFCVFANSQYRHQRRTWSLQRSWLSFHALDLSQGPSQSSEGFLRQKIWCIFPPPGNEIIRE